MPGSWPTTAASMPDRLARNDFATVSSASWGHAVNQSMVVQLTSDGNLRRRSRNASPTGENDSTTCRLRLTSDTKNEYSASLEPSIPACLARPPMFSKMGTRSPAASRLGTSYVLSRLEMSSTNDSSLIWVSANRNTTGLLASPAVRSTRRRSSCHSALPYVLEISIWKSSYSSMNAASRVRLCRPEPPSPTSSALPPGDVITLQMRHTCSSANWKMTRFIGFFDVALKSDRYSATTAYSRAGSLMSTYARDAASVPGTMKSPNMRSRSEPMSTSSSPGDFRPSTRSGFSLKCASANSTTRRPSHVRSSSHTSRS
mmetsp:Transcript_5846/g.17897  ORF Transcript_5846/g.17897 Transcript_5846/m.17897 type:complete len:315 (+) Transcript_5846:1681-2625(+)